MVGITTRLIAAAASLWLGAAGGTLTAAAEPAVPDLSDLRDAVKAADKRGDNVTAVAKALDALEVSVAKGWAFPAPGRTVPAPVELAAVREAVELAKAKGENVEAVLRQLELLEKAMTGQVLARPKAVPPPVRVWRYDAGGGKVGTIAGTDGGDWVEKRAAGEPPSRFKCVRRTERFTELYDKDRDFTLNLYETGASEWSVGGGAWHAWLKGTWVEEKKP
ncbi:MAG: hypothetical protein ACKODX_14260 [Gemmata sp.]